MQPFMSGNMTNLVIFKVVIFTKNLPLLKSSQRNQHRFLSREADFSNNRLSFLRCRNHTVWTFPATTHLTQKKGSPLACPPGLHKSMHSSYAENKVPWIMPVPRHLALRLSHSQDFPSLSGAFLCGVWWCLEFDQTLKAWWDARLISTKSSHWNMNWRIPL